MNITIRRGPSNQYGTPGELLTDREWEAVTLEPSHPIPEGTYLAARYLSPKRGYYVPLLQGVPGHKYIEIHRGTVAGDPPLRSDSEDCILIGTRRGYVYDRMGENPQPGILFSADAFTDLMRQPWETLQVTIIDDPTIPPLEAPPDAT